MFGRFKVHAGDFRPGDEHQVAHGNLIMKVPGKFFRQKIPLSAIEVVEPASEDSVTKVGGAIGWGAAGALLFGPAGLIAGALLGGRGKDVTFVCRLKDGRKFLATAPSGVYQTISTSVAAANFA